MKRRLIAVAATTLAAMLVLAGIPARAAGIINSTAEYRLTSSSDIAVPDPNASGPQVIAAIVPPGTVVPLKQADGTDGSPLTILKSSTGFDENQLIVALKDNLSNSGETPQQLFGLSFFGNGFSKNGQLDFSLNLDSSVATPPVLQPLTPGISIVALQTTDPNSTTTTTTPTPPTTVQNTVPEPMSVALWAALAGAGLIRVRARSFRRAAAA